MTAYFTLITSLPRHGRDYKIKEPPISRLQLDKRLKILDMPERNILNNFLFCVWDSWYNLKLPFSATFKAAKAIEKLQNPFLNELLQWIFDIRSIFVALRLRHSQHTPPANPQEYWATHWNHRLITHWDATDFSLKNVYPWLPEVATKMSNHESDAVEDILLALLWQHLAHIETRHVYDFAAIVIYVMRWNIVNYWSQFNEEIAFERIHKWCDEILKAANVNQYVSMQNEESPQ